MTEQFYNFLLCSLPTKYGDTFKNVLHKIMSVVQVIPKLYNCFLQCLIS